MMVVHTSNRSAQETEAEGLRFEASLGYTVRPSLKRLSETIAFTALFSYVFMSLTSLEILKGRKSLLFIYAQPSCVLCTWHVFKIDTE